MNNIGMNSMNTVNSGGILSDSAIMNSNSMNGAGWTIFHLNNAKNITPLKFWSISLNVWIVNWHSYFVWEPNSINDIFQGLGTDPRDFMEMMVFYPQCRIWLIAFNNDL